jgi:group I intron endonuclease
MKASAASRDVCSIYIVTNSINDKVYVGQTWRTLHTRFYYHKNPNDNHCKKMHRAFNKHGRDNFSIECIAVCSDQITADYLETLYIKEYDSIKNGYNIKDGGSAGKHSEESKKKISLSNIGKHNIPASEEKKKQISQSLKGRKMSQEHIDNRSKSMIDGGKRKGIPLSEMTKRKLSESHKGIKFSEEVKKNMSKAHKGKPWSQARRDAQNKKEN